MLYVVETLISKYISKYSVTSDVECYRLRLRQKTSRNEIMSIQMQQITFDGSLKNIPHSGRKEYFMNMFHEVSRFMKDVEWGVAMDEVEEDENRKETWGFPTQNSAPGPFPLLDKFKERIANLIKNKLKSLKVAK